MSLRVAGAAVAACCVLSGTAAAQEVSTAVTDLQDNNVTFEDGALSQDELDGLDATTADLQDSAGYFKVVVLADDVSNFSDADGYADAVRTALGGRGRVMVYAPTEVALSSNLDPSVLVDDAERAAADSLNGGSTLAVATAQAGTKLSSDISGTAKSALDAAGDGDGGGGGSGWGLLLLLLAPLVALVGFLWWTARKMRKRADAVSHEQIGEAETKVRTAVDAVANDVLDLSDQIDQPGTPPEAKAAFTQGAELFTSAQEMLESADTRSELEAAYPKVVEAGWQMDTAKALLAGQPAPPKPDPEPLFPRVVTTRPSSPGPVDATGAPVPAGADAGAPAARPEPHYRQSGSSPWLTAAAMAAITVLSQRGMSVPQTRRPMDDGAFGNWSDELPPLPSSNRNRGFGFGRRGEKGGRVVVPSGQGRGMGRRGMGRR